MRRGHVLLINPRATRPAHARIPLSLLALGAVLEGRYDYDIVDGNVEPDPSASALKLLANRTCDAVGVTVMPGPQVVQAVEISSAIRAAYPRLPIVWGGYFPTLYASAAINASYVDFVVRGPGEETLLALLERLPDAGAPDAANSGTGVLFDDVPSLTWKRAGVVVHNDQRKAPKLKDGPVLPLHRITEPDRYHPRTYLGARTGVYQAAMGCRFHCNFCGVVSMFNGKTWSEDQDRLRRELTAARDRFGVTALQYYDNNFFDTEAASRSLLEVLADVQLPYWCFSRADALAKFSNDTWALVRRSRLRMTYIGAEASDNETLRKMRKGTTVEQTFQAVARCREHGVTPELSFILGAPEDPEGHTEHTLQFVRQLKHRSPEAEIVLYFYTPTPQRDPRTVAGDRGELQLPQQRTYGPDGPAMPTTPEEWTEPRWINYVCHADAPWLTPALRKRVADFAQVLACRFPTVQDVKTPAWGKAVLRELARWRYATGRYSSPWELALARRVIPLKVPQVEGL